jgi:hypothetical protein
MATTSSAIPEANVTLTAKQKMEARKQAAIRQREEELKQAAGQAKGNYDQAKFARQQNTFDHMMRV